MSVPPSIKEANLSAALENPTVQAALVAAGVSIVIAFANVYFSKDSETRQRRLALYADAFRTALAWKEMLYRVRRRSGTEEDDRRLVDQFHKLQEDLDYYQGWIGSESVYMCRSYCRLVESVRSKAKPLIDQAWRLEPRKPSDGTPVTDVHVDVSEESKLFLSDVRAHFSPFWAFWTRVAFFNRNRSEKANPIAKRGSNAK